MDKHQFKEFVLKDVTAFQLCSLIFWSWFNRKRVDKFIELRTEGWSVDSAFNNCKK